MVDDKEALDDVEGQQDQVFESQMQMHVGIGS